MRLTNKTAWRTDDLKAVVAEALRVDGIGPQGFNVTVTSTRSQRGPSDYCSGFAYYNSRRMTLRVPPANVRDFSGRPTLTRLVMTQAMLTELARVTLHEACHCRGLRHEDMARDLMRTHRGGTDDRDVSEIIAGRSVRLDRPAPKPSPAARAKDRTAERAQHAASMLARAERRLKLAKTLASKWRAKVRYYQRRAAANGTVER